MSECILNSIIGVGGESERAKETKQNIHKTSDSPGTCQAFSTPQDFCKSTSTEVLE